MLKNTSLFSFLFFLPNKNLCSYDQQQQIDSSWFIEKTCYHCFIQWLFFKSLTNTRKLLKDYHYLVYSPSPPHYHPYSIPLFLFFLHNNRNSSYFPFSSLIYMYHSYFFFPLFIYLISMLLYSNKH